MLARMYISTSPIVKAFAQVKNTSSTPQIRTQANATTCTATSRWIELTGVFRFGFTFPRAVGSTPERPMAYQVLVPPLKQAIDTAIAEFSRAKSRKTQAPLHTCCANVATGHAVAVGMVPTLLTPMPTRYPQVTNTK